MIRKAGGIEELEKHLKVHDDGTASINQQNNTVGSTTQRSIISKSLYQRVLSRAAATTTIKPVQETTEAKKISRVS